MRVKILMVLIVQALLVVLVAIAVAKKWSPLGVPGEWEWLRVPFAPTGIGLVVAGLAVAAYAGLAALGYRSLATAPSRLIEAIWLALLFVGALCAQVLVPLGAPEGYDLSKWAAVNYLPGSAGYFKVARQEAMSDPWGFLARYPEWIKTQDSLHIGTHPPGLIVAQCVLMRAMERKPDLAEFLHTWMPPSVRAAFRVFTEGDARPLSRGERAALYATALLTLFACAGTVVPLYLLARVALPARAAWAAAALWPLAPAANLFQPDADTAYPLLSTTALALAAWAGRLARGRARPSTSATTMIMAAGAVMAIGMSCTLAFLPVGLIVAIAVAGDLQVPWKTRIALIMATGVGFLSIVLAAWWATGANPVVIASWNLRNHARFYDEYPRTYLYWLLANPVELAIAIGLPSVIWCAIGFVPARDVPGAAWATLLVVVFVNLIGRNLGEVARLWILFMPPLLVAAGAGCQRLGAGPAALAASTALVGLETLALQAMIQVVYPV